MSEVLLKIRNLKTRLGDNNHPVYAVDGVDIEVYRGEVFALLGESGCGKSITALSAMRLLPLPAGSFRERPGSRGPICSNCRKWRCAGCVAGRWE